MLAHPAALTSDTELPTMSKATNHPTTFRMLAYLRRILPATFRAASSQIEIAPPLSVPPWAPQTVWLVDTTGRCFVRMA